MRSVLRCIRPMLAVGTKSRLIESNVSMMQTRCQQGLLAPVHGIGFVQRSIPLCGAYAARLKHAQAAGEDADAVADPRGTEEQVELNPETREILAKVPNLLTRVEELIKLLPRIDPLLVVSKAPGLVDISIEDIARRRELLHNLFPQHDVDLWIGAQPKLLLHDNARALIEKLASIDQQFPGFSVVKHLDNHPKILNTRHASVFELSQLLQDRFPSIPRVHIVDKAPKILLQRPTTVDARIGLLFKQEEKYDVKVVDALKVLPQLLTYPEPRLDRFAFLHRFHPEDLENEVLALNNSNFLRRYGSRWVAQVPLRQQRKARNTGKNET